MQFNKHIYGESPEDLRIKPDFRAVKQITRTSLVVLVAFLVGSMDAIAQGSLLNCYANTLSVKEDETNLTVIVVRSGTVSSNATVSFHTADGTAISGVNYGATEGSLTFTPGVTNQSFIVPILDDHSISGDKTFMILLTDPSDGDSLGSSSNVIVTVVDVDLGIEFAQTNYLTDVFQSSVTISLRLLRTHPGGRSYFHAPVSIDYATADGTAQVGRDYESAAGTINYSPSYVQFAPPPPSFLITLHDDTSAYGDHTVQLTLRNPSSNLVLGTLTAAVLTIKNDNTAAGVQVGLNAPIQAMVVQADGKVVVAGEFTLIDGQPRNHLARLSPDGLLDATFDPGSGTDGDVLALALQTDGKVIVGGTFTNLAGVYCGRIARLNADGSVDSSFNTGLGWLAPDGVTAGVTALAVQSDGRILSGASLMNFDGATRMGVARLNPDGSLDPTFVPAIQPLYSDPGFVIGGVASLANGKVVVSGTFQIPAYSSNTSLAVLNGDGSVDTNFVVTLPEFWYVFSRIGGLAVGPDGDILATSTSAYSGWLPLLKLHPDGTLAPGFPPRSLSNGAGSITVQTDGRILVTQNGGFLTWDGHYYYELLRLASSGSVDASFPGVKYDGNSVSKAAQLPDGTIWAIGGFREGSTRPPFYLRRLNPGGTDIQDLHFLRPVRLSNGEVHLALRGQWTTPYVVQASEDLINWTTVVTNDRPHVPIGYIDHDAVQYSQRYYRLR